MTLPGFTADRALGERAPRYRLETASSPGDDASGRIVPAAHGVQVSTGHCGCYIDDWWGLPCLCIEYW
jgi:hypothetical protein